MRPNNSGNAFVIFKTNQNIHHPNPNPNPHQKGNNVVDVV